MAFYPPQKWVTTENTLCGFPRCRDIRQGLKQTWTLAHCLRKRKAPVHPQVENELTLDYWLQYADIRKPPEPFLQILWW